MTTPRIEEKQGRKIGEDKYTEHWSLDGSTYVQVPKWVIAEAHQAGKKAGRDEAVEKQKKEELTEIEIQNIVIETIGSQYQKRFNEYLDYDQWQGIREEMRICGTMIFKRMKEDLELNRQALDDTIKALKDKK